MLIKGTQRHNLTARIGPFTDQGCFLVAFFTGVISILSLKYLAAPQLVVTGVPVLIMLSYLALMLVFRRMRVDDDQAGDNLYYLGFLFTLTSLGCALFQYNGSSSKESIIQNFGIALATTIVGLICRVIFGQMRHDPVETEREVRMELAHVAGRLRDQMIQANNILDTASTAVRQQSAEVLAKYVVELNALVVDSMRSSQEHVAALSQQTLAMTQETSRLAALLREMAQRVEEAEAARRPAPFAPEFEELRGRVKEAAIAAQDSANGEATDEALQRLEATMLETIDRIRSRVGSMPAEIRTEGDLESSDEAKPREADSDGQAV
jgi:hypothetical protein